MTTFHWLNCRASQFFVEDAMCIFPSRGLQLIISSCWRFFCGGLTVLPVIEVEWYGSLLASRLSSGFPFVNFHSPTGHHCTPCISLGQSLAHSGQEITVCEMKLAKIRWSAACPIPDNKNRSRTSVLLLQEKLHYFLPGQAPSAPHQPKSREWAMACAAGGTEKARENAASWDWNQETVQPFWRAGSTFC